MEKEGRGSQRDIRCLSIMCPFTRVRHATLPITQDESLWWLLHFLFILNYLHSVSVLTHPVISCGHNPSAQTIQRGEPQHPYNNQSVYTYMLRFNIPGVRNASGSSSPSFFYMLNMIFMMNTHINPMYLCKFSTEKRQSFHSLEDHIILVL